MTPNVTQLHQLGRNSWRCRMTKSKTSKRQYQGRAKTPLGAYVNALVAMRLDGPHGRYA